MEDIHLGWFVAIGFFAQLVDGAIGMAYGTLSNAILIALGLPPALASTSVNLAKVATNGVSALSHAYFRNVDRRLLFGLVVPAMLGAVVGGTALVQLSPALVKPVVAVVLAALGVLIVIRAVRGRASVRPSRHPIVTGFVAGAINSTTGSFGPFATSAMIARGIEPRYAVGTVSVVEFFVALASVAALASLLDDVNLQVILALILGGLPAAPVAAFLVRHMPSRAMMLVVGSIVVGLSVYTLWRVAL
jgi:hypothetical protein